MYFMYVLCAAFIAALLASEFSIAMMLVLPIYLFAVGTALGKMADEMDKEEEWE